MEPGTVASLIPAGIAAAGTAASIAQQAGLFGSNKSSAPKVGPAPTVNTAADAIAAADAEDKKRRSWQAGASSTQLTPVGGVSSDLTGTRMLTSGS